jgi:hypothetical protein
LRRAGSISALCSTADRADDAFGDPALQIERSVESTVETVGPEMLAARRFYELATDPDRLPGSHGLPSTTHRTRSRAICFETAASPL